MTWRRHSCLHVALMPTLPSVPFTASKRSRRPARVRKPEVSTTAGTSACATSAGGVRNAHYEMVRKLQRLAAMGPRELATGQGEAVFPLDRIGNGHPPVAVPALLETTWLGAWGSLLSEPPRKLAAICPRELSPVDRPASTRRKTLPARDALPRSRAGRLGAESTAPPTRTARIWDGRFCGPITAGNDSGGRRQDSSRV